MDQNQRLILVELEDRVEGIFAGIEELRATGHDGKARRALLDSIFRSVHSVKGSASANGLDHIASFAHEFESLLHSLRTGRARLDENLLQTFEETAEALLDALHHEAPPDPGKHIALLGRLRELSERAVDCEPIEVESLLSGLPADVSHSLSQDEKHHLKESIGEGANLYLVATCFDLINFDQQFQRLQKILSETGEVISTAPKVDSEHPDKINFRILFAGNADLEEVQKSVSEVPDVSVTELTNSTIVQAIYDTGFSNVYKPTSETASHLIRISLDDVDSLISSAHRIYYETSAVLEQAIENLTEVRIQTELRTAAAGIRNSFLRLAAEIIDLRMVPVDGILQRAFRAGRAAARIAGKEIDFIVTGRTTLLDKSLVDAIADPLIHLVRNAVDHGIEPAAERVKTGKNERGSICIEASTSNGQTRIKVSDDGRGIVPEIISASAVSKRLAPQGTALDMKQSLRLIFRPGFSTTKSVSDLSGRGVGLDVVEMNVERVGGNVRVESKPGAGSSFEITLPVTFGLLETTSVRSGNHVYLLDNSHIVSSRSIDSHEIEMSDTGDFLPGDNEALRLVNLHELLEHADDDSEMETFGLLVCQFPADASNRSGASARQALLVDEIGETQQVLVRNLGSRGARWFGVAGAAELPDGSVALLLDLARLMNSPL